jgi:hypothetical protein
MDRDRVIARVREIAANRKNTRFSELESLLDNHIRYLVPTYNHHGSPHHAFTVGRSTFNISEPKQGALKKPYINQFLDAMAAEGLFDPEEDS